MAIEAGRASLTLRVPSSVEAIRGAAQQAESWLAERQVSCQAMYLASLAIEEIVLNCIKYGYSDSRHHAVDIVFGVNAGVLTIDTLDDGNPFNPWEASPPDLSIAAEKRPVGGLGRHLLRQLADEVGDERRDGTNWLRVVKRMLPGGRP